MEHALPDVKQQLTLLRNQLEEVSEEVYSRGEVRKSCVYCVAVQLCVLLPLRYCLVMRWGRGGEGLDSYPLRYPTRRSCTPTGQAGGRAPYHGPFEGHHGHGGLEETIWVGRNGPSLSAPFRLFIHNISLLFKLFFN